MTCYIVTYLITLAISSCASLARSKIAKGFLCFLSIVPLIVLAGIRDDTIGWDTNAYPLEIYNYSLLNTFNDTISYYSSNYEFLFLVVTWCITKVFRNFAVVLTTYAIIMLVPVAIAFFIEYPKKFVIAIMAYALIVFPLSLTIIRQEMAFSIILFGYLFLKRKKYLLFLGTIVVAYLFHAAALLALILIPVYYILNIKVKNDEFDKQKKLRIIMIVLIVLTIIYLFAMLFGDKLILAFSTLKISYEQQAANIGKSKVAYSSIIMFITNIIVYYLAASRQTNAINKKFHINLTFLFIVSAIAFLFGLFSLISIMLQRIGLCFYVFLSLYYCEALEQCKNKNTRKILYILVILIIIAYGVYSFYGQGSSGINPYSSHILESFMFWNLY